MKRLLYDDNLYTKNGGTQREVTLYAEDGNVVRKWSGKIDFDNTGSVVYFDLEGRRIAISGTIVIEEK